SVDFSYEVTPLTMALLSKTNDEGLVQTVVLEESQHYFVSPPPTKVMDKACEYYGQSLQGLQKGTKNVSNITNKAPIAIDSRSGMYFFPTASPSKKTCSWLSHTHITNIFPIHNGSGTEVIFNNEHRIAVNISFGSIQNQMHRTAQFRFYLDNRIQRIKDAVILKETTRIEL